MSSNRVDAAPITRHELATFVAAYGYDPETATAVLITHDTVRVATLIDDRSTTYVHPVIDEASS